MTIEQVAAQYPTLQRSACAAVARLLHSRGAVLNDWTIADAISEATGNDPSCYAVRNAIRRARKAGIDIITRHGIGYQIVNNAPHKQPPPASLRTMTGS